MAADTFSFIALRVCGTSVEPSPAHHRLGNVLVAPIHDLETIAISSSRGDLPDVSRLGLEPAAAQGHSALIVAFFEIAPMIRIGYEIVKLAGKPYRYLKA